MQFKRLKRREFITLLGGAAVWPVAAAAQQRERMRRISVLMSLAADDAESSARIAAFHQGLEGFGWSVGRNLRIETRWGAGNGERMRQYAADLVALAPDAILAGASPATRGLKQATRTIPIVFANVTDPISAGFVESLARPGGNVTGFMNTEYGASGKWLELLKEIAPRVTRAAALRDPAIAAGSGQPGAIQGVAPMFGVEVTPVDVREASEIERAIAAFAGKANGGLIVTGSSLVIIHRKLIIELAARHQLPAVYAFVSFVTRGGLLAYGPDRIAPYRQAASYIDRILKGEKPEDLPVQAPTKYELLINLKTAKALGLTIPDKLLATADEVIE